MSNYYETEKEYFEKGVVLFVPGMMCTEGTFAGMFEQLKKLENSTNVLTDDIVLTINNIESDEVEEIFKEKSKLNKVICFKTLFTDSFDLVDNQVEELNKIIKKIRLYFDSSYPIKLVGYSKGGLVCMRYVSTHKGIVENIVSIGTPYKLGAFQEILNAFDDALHIIDDIDFLDLLKDLINKIDSYVDHDLASSEFYTRLKRDWDSLPENYRPCIATIACSQFGFTGNSNPKYGGDVVVSCDSQNADSFNRIDYRYLISSDHYLYFSDTEWYDALYQVTVGAIEAASDIIKGFVKFGETEDMTYALLGVVFALLPYKGADNLEQYDLVHTAELKNMDVCLKMLEALDLTKKHFNDTNEYYENDQTVGGNGYEY